MTLGSPRASQRREPPGRGARRRPGPGALLPTIRSRLAAHWGYSSSTKRWHPPGQPGGELEVGWCCPAQPGRARGRAGEKRSGSNPGASTRPARAAHRQQGVDLRLAARSPLDPEGVQKPLTTAEPGTGVRSPPIEPDRAERAEAQRHEQRSAGSTSRTPSQGTVARRNRTRARTAEPHGPPPAPEPSGAACRNRRARRTPPVVSGTARAASATPTPDDRHPHPPHPPPGPASFSNPSSGPRDKHPQGPLRGPPQGGPERLGAAALICELLVLHNSP